MGARLLLLSLFVVFVPALGYTNQLYDGATGSVSGTWQSYSWNTNLQSTVSPAPGYPRSAALSAGGGFVLHNFVGFDPRYWSSLTFLGRSATGSQSVPLAVQQVGSGTGAIGTTPSYTFTTSWQTFTVPLASAFGSLPVGTLLGEFKWTLPGGAPDVYFTNIYLTGANPAAPPGAITVTVNTALNRKNVSPLVYGVNFADAAQLSAARYTANRKGGNAETRYAWQTSSTNTCNDWYWENNPADSAATFIGTSRNGGAAPLTTIGITGYVAKDNFSCSYSAPRFTVAQNAYDPYRTNCGNGRDTSYTLLTGAVASDTSLSVTATYWNSWFDSVGANVGWISLDNEPDLWHSTHYDIHPTPATYDELWSKTSAWAAGLKTKVPALVTTGPALSSWCNMMYLSDNTCQGQTDYTNHGSVPFLQWYINQIKAYATANSGKILVDVIDVHPYTGNLGVSLSSTEDPITSQARLRSTRGLWDMTYYEEAWFAQPTAWIPRIKSWIQAAGLSLKVALTEFSYGNPDIITGALAHADALGVFGVQGVDAAYIWVAPTLGSIGEDAYKIYINYDGAGGKVGSVSVSTTTSNDFYVQSYGFTDAATTKVWVVLICRDPANTISTNVNVASAIPGSATASLYRFTQAQRLTLVSSAIAITSGVASVSLPPYSVSLLVASVPAPVTTPPVTTPPAPVTTKPSTTAPPPATTAPPPATTAPPPATTAPPPATTAPPPATTKPSTTAPTTTAPPPATTAPPPATTAPTTTKPSTTAPSPATSAPPPATTAPSPATTAPSPATTAPSPATTAPSPATTAPSPATTAPSPATTAPSPATTAPSPATTAPSPATTAPSPATTAPSPATTAPSPATTAPSPATTTPSPATTAPSPATTAPSPATTAPSPATTVPSPVTTVPSPSTTVPSPTTSTSTPDPASTTPAVSTTVPPSTTAQANCDLTVVTLGCVAPSDLINALAAAMAVSASQISEVSYIGCPGSDSANHDLVLSLNGGDCSWVQLALGTIPAVNQTMGGPIVRATNSAVQTPSTHKGKAFPMWIIAVIVVGVLVVVAIGVAVFFLVKHLAGKSSSGYGSTTRQNWTMDEMYSTATL